MAKKSASILVIAAHPDDEILGIGGVILAEKTKGAKEHTVILGEGITSRYHDPLLADPRLIKNYIKTSKKSPNLCEWIASSA